MSEQGSALLKLGMKTRVANYLRLLPVVAHSIEKNGLGIRLPIKSVKIASGAKKGEALEGTLVKANQIVEISAGATVSPVRYQAIITLNPKLVAEGLRGSTFFVEPGDLLELTFKMKPDTDFDLADVSWLCRIYMID